MVNDKQKISVLVNELCAKHWHRQCNKIYTFLYNDFNYISDNYIKSAVDQKTLLKFLQKSKYSSKMQFILLEIVFFIDEDSITDTVIDFCINYHGKYRKTLIAQLAHIYLKPNQLEMLNLHMSTAEAFCKLVLIYATNNDFTADYLSSLLIKNQSKVDAAKYCVAKALKDGEIVEKEKLLVLKDFGLI